MPKSIAPNTIRMQIFVKQPTASPTLLYTCSEQTTLNEFLLWVEDKTAISECHYYITYRGHYLAKSTEEQKASTFANLGITKDSTVHLNARLCVNVASKKLNASA
jgi:hypothetical protein